MVALLMYSVNDLIRGCRESEGRSFSGLSDLRALQNNILNTHPPPPPPPADVPVVFEIAYPGLIMTDWCGR